jgi:hypothetical protein
MLGLELMKRESFDSHRISPEFLNSIGLKKSSQNFGVLLISAILLARNVTY